MELAFYKYEGTGNDFILIDNRNGDIKLSQDEIAHLCNRRFGIGADGLMLLNLQAGYDFEMKYYNSDGAAGSMCGNGGRCLTQFAFDCGIQQSRYHFIASDGPHEAIIEKKGWVKLKMKDVDSIRKEQNASILNTGSPHYILPVSQLNQLDVFTEGKKIRYSDAFKIEGINVNFVEQLADNQLQVRTYERGVEDETYSCGTGVTAAALSNPLATLGKNTTQIITKGGNLSVEFEKIDEQNFKKIWLCGPAKFVFKGTIVI
ncbi:diaminopimelate epimerase [Sediminibacterium sp.]|uniref:diaminopimelate epimerase n=1 Tax=Sediminibacterium sp. TaxID=1917865 RepID=UPI003F70D95E